MNDGVYNPLLEYKYSEYKEESISFCDEKEEQPLIMVDEIDKIREEQRSKEQVARDIYSIIDGEGDLPTDDEVLTKMIEMSKGYNLMEIVQLTTVMVPIIFLTL